MKRHALSTRIWHWINALSVIVLFMSGLNISNAHPWLYWGQSGFLPSQSWLHVPRFPGWATIYLSPTTLGTIAAIPHALESRTPRCGPAPVARRARAPQAIASTALGLPAAPPSRLTLQWGGAILRGPAGSPESIERNVGRLVAPQRRFLLVRGRATVVATTMDAIIDRGKLTWLNLSSRLYVTC